MPIDTSIYQNIQPVQIPSMLDSQAKAMALSKLGIENQTAQYQMAKQQALQQAYAKAVKPDGSIDKDAVVKNLTQLGYGMDAMGAEKSFAETDKASAEAKGAQADAHEKIVGATLPAMEYLKSLPSEKQPDAYHGIMQNLHEQGIPMQNVPAEFKPEWLDQTIGVLRNTKQSLEAQKTKAEIGKTYSDIGQAPAKLNAELFGSRSPNATLSDEYNKQMDTIRKSQVSMQQMMDSYNNKTPQGDASLVLQNFRIRNPGVPDVNSIDEMKTSQNVSDAWKNKLYQATNGGFDDNTRNNLIRDGISAFRANYQTMKGVQARTQARQQIQNVNDPSLTYEPAIEDTNKTTSALQDKLGQYVPAKDRGGLMSKLSGLFSSEGTASAAPQKAPPKPGDVSQGHVFMGGDPSKPSSWKKQ